MRLQTGAAGDKHWFRLLLIIDFEAEVFLIKRERRIEYFVGLDLKQISFIIEKSVAS